MSILVNGVEITDEAIHREMQYHPTNSLESARHDAAQALIVRQLLLQQAQAIGLCETVEKLDVNQEEAMIDRLIDQEVSVPEADEKSCKRYFKRNVSRFRNSDEDPSPLFEQVEQHVREYLRSRSLHTGIADYIKALVGRATIVGYDMP